MQRVMQSEMSHLEHLFEEFLKTLHEAIEVLNSQQCEPNRANSLLYRLRDFEITLGLISSQELHYQRTCRGFCAAPFETTWWIFNSVAKCWSSKNTVLAYWHL